MRVDKYARIDAEHLMCNSLDGRVDVETMFSVFVLSTVYVSDINIPVDISQASGIGYLVKQNGKSCPYYIYGDTLWAKVNTGSFVVYCSENLPNNSDLESTAFVYRTQTLSFTNGGNTSYILVDSFTITSDTPFSVVVLPGFVSVVGYVNNTLYSTYTYMIIDDDEEFCIFFGNTNTACGTVPPDYPPLPNALPTHANFAVSLLPPGLNCLRLNNSTSTTMENTLQFSSYDFNTLFSGLYSITPKLNNYPAGTHTISLYNRVDNIAQTSYLTYWKCILFKSAYPLEIRQYRVVI